MGAGQLGGGVLGGELINAQLLFKDNVNFNKIGTMF
jgi:hypothetical protein